MSDRELYYAHMEADRNESEDAYFNARPQSDTLTHRALFRAGYERAYDKLWPLYGAPSTTGEAPAAPCERCGGDGIDPDADYYDFGPQPRPCKLCVVAHETSAAPPCPYIDCKIPGEHMHKINGPFETGATLAPDLAAAIKSGVPIAKLLNVPGLVCAVCHEAKDHKPSCPYSAVSEDASP